MPVTELCLEAAPEAAYVRDEVVEVITLDPLHFDDTAPILIKADVQGFESEVLRGAEAVLRRTTALELELSLVPLYVGQQLAHEVCAFARQSDFVPVAVGNPFRHPSTGEILSLDVLFRRVDGAGDSQIRSW